VSAFFEQVGEIFQTACDAGGENCDWAILVNRDGGIQMMPASGWATESLRLHLGAQAAYRVSRRNGEVEVEGRSGKQTCRLRSEPAKRLLDGSFDFPRYVTI
jgi:hypothetical protein